MTGRLIDWFDEHGRKHYDPWAKRWVLDDLIPPVPAEGQTGVPVFDLTNVALLIDRDGDPFLDTLRKAEAATGTGIGRIARDEANALIQMSIRDTFPNVRPPYESFWCEALVGDGANDPESVRVGWAVAYSNHEGAVAFDRAEVVPEGALAMFVKLYASARGGQMGPGPFCWGSCGIHMREDGTITQLLMGDVSADRDEVTKEKRELARHTMLTHVNVLLLGLSLMNARNIVQVAERPGGQTTKRARRGLPPEREVRVLRLDGRFAQRAASSAEGEATGTKRRHTYRGHWKEYGMKPGQGLLFGKYRCRVYVPDGQRGAADLGVVDKRYVVVPWPKGPA